MTTESSKIISRYAAKFAAETIGAEPSLVTPPTHKALREVLQHCVIPPKSDQYESIRERFMSEYGARYFQLTKGL